MRHCVLMARMSARFGGKCSGCAAVINTGDTIDYDRATRRVLCGECAPPSAPATPAVVHVSIVDTDLVVRLSGRLDSGAFQAFRSAIGSAKFRDGANFIPLTRAAETIAALASLGMAVDVSAEARAAVESHAAQVQASLAGAAERTDAVDALLASRGGSLYPYQRDGVAWLAPRTAALVADDMGLGKTIQTLVAAPAGAPILVICPAVAKGVWEQEAARWRQDLTVTVLSGRASFRAPVPGELVAINYDILPTDPPALAPGTVVILDEAHAAANPKSQRTERCRELCKAARAGGGRTWLLTATPMKNKPQELWSVLRVAGLETEAYGSWNRFCAAYNGVRGRFAYEWGMPGPEAAVGLQRVSLRRRKVDVLTDLPAKTYRSLPATIDRATARLCDEVLAEIMPKPKRKKKKGAEQEQPTLNPESAVETVLSAVNAISFERMSAVRAALAQAKIPAMLEVIENYEKQDEPLVVFSAYRAPIDILAQREGWAAITGDTSNDSRTDIVRRFQAGELRGVACTIRAGGVAITLTRASNVLRVDREWNPALNVQAEDRCYRIGQRSAVLVTDLVARHPLDSALANCLARKERLIAASVDAAAVTHVGAAPSVNVDWAALEEQTANAARELAAAEDAARTAKNEHEKWLAETRHTAALAGARARVRLASAIRLGEEQVPEDAARRGPSSSLEQWAIDGIRELAARDPDRAEELNGIGYSKSDGGLGHALSQLHDLTDQEWRLAVRLAKHYHRQLGAAPREAA